MLTRSDISRVLRGLIHADGHYMGILWDIEEFNNIFKIPTNLPLYVELLREETIEFMEEILEKGVTHNLLKETADILYILEGMLSMIPEEEVDLTEIEIEQLLDVLDVIHQQVTPLATTLFTQEQIYQAFRETHRSNLSKLDVNLQVLRREDGKVLKGDLYQPADMKPLYDTAQRVEAVQIELGIF